MQVAWELGIKKLEIESDSLDAISCLSADKADQHRHCLVRRILAWTQKDWEVVFLHIGKWSSYILSEKGIYVQTG